MKGSDRTYLRGLAHHLRPSVQIGREGLTDAVVEAIDTALGGHELIKVQLVADKDEKRAAAAAIAARLGAECAGIIGHILIIYREHPDPERRKIRLPSAS